MPIILIVDDSEVDQRLVGGLIKKDLEWIVEYASDGEAALEIMETAAPNVVVTDLMMPKMDGIELVKQSKTRFSQIPVILMTGKGSESKAVEALQAGAASYVPKAALADRLMDTIEQVLKLANLDESESRLMKCITNSRHQFKLPNDPELIAPLISFVRHLMAKLNLGDEARRRHAGVALEEAIINAMFHGNLELADFQAHDARRELHEINTCQAIEERRQTEPYNQRSILFGFDITPQKAQFVIRDKGPGFDTSEMPSKSEIDNLSELTNRGLTLIGQFMDEVGFNETGNEIRMAMHCQ